MANYIKGVKKIKQFILTEWKGEQSVAQELLKVDTLQKLEQDDSVFSAPGPKVAFPSDLLQFLLGRLLVDRVLVSPFGTAEGSAGSGGEDIVPFAGPKQHAAREALTRLMESLLDDHADARHALYRLIDQWAKSSFGYSADSRSEKLQLDMFVYLMLHMMPPPLSNDEIKLDSLLCMAHLVTGKSPFRDPAKRDDAGGCPKVLLAREHSVAFTEAWLALLKRLMRLDPPTQPSAAKHALDLVHDYRHPPEPLHAILFYMNRRIIPYMVRPTQLMDFLTGAYDAGGWLALLALACLFRLITAHNMDYPHFYPKAYALLDANVLHVPYRTRLFKLIGTFLASPLLPAYLVAAFVKRTARLALLADPGSLPWLLAFCFNCIKMHPSLLVLIHRVDPPTIDDAVAQDPFRMEETDPAACCAMASCLWELEALSRHMQSRIPRDIAVLFREKSGWTTKPPQDLADPALCRPAIEVFAKAVAGLTHQVETEAKGFRHCAMLIPPASSATFSADPNVFFDFSL